jgi:hypothetical protein
MSQQSLCPQGSSCSPIESNTNSHIASINLNRDRFDYVLTALGGASPSKNITPPDSPTYPLDEPVDLLPLPMSNYDDLTNKEPQDQGHSTVWINKTPTSEPPNESLQVEQGSSPPQPQEEVQPRPPQQPILRNTRQASHSSKRKRNLTRPPANKRTASYMTMPTSCLRK